MGMGEYVNWCGQGTLMSKIHTDENFRDKMYKMVKDFVDDSSREVCNYKNCD